MLPLDVNIICRNYREDRVIPRFSRYLADNLGWYVSKGPTPGFDVYYLSGYFEIQMFKGEIKSPMAAYFTHREESPPGNAKSKLFDRVASIVDLRIVTAPMYGAQLVDHGETVRIYPPVETHCFTIPKKQKNRKMVAGFSGYTYANRRKGEDLARGLVNSRNGKSISWSASGRGWPVKTVRYSWADLPSFYQSLDILVCTANVEGVPMPPLEVLSCGGSVVIPEGVGLLDELPNISGIHRYKKGDMKSLVAAFDQAVEMRAEVDRGDLRASIDPYSILAWCEGHRMAFMEAFL